MTFKFMRIVFLTATVIAGTGAAHAQSSSLKPFPLGGRSATPVSTKSMLGVKIAVTYRFFIEGSTNSMADQTKLADQGRKHLYLMLAKECVVLKETIAETCSLERASVNSRMSMARRRRQKGVRVSGSASYRIALKKNAE